MTVTNLCALAKVQLQFYKFGISFCDKELWSLILFTIFFRYIYHVVSVKRSFTDV